MDHASAWHYTMNNEINWDEQKPIHSISMDNIDKINKFSDFVTKEWKQQDWKNHRQSTLRKQIYEWLGFGGNLSHFPVARIEFGRWMGW